jgi:hypothetical protein
MYRNEGCIGDKIAIRSEKRTGEVEAFFDVGADAGLLQRPPHCLCNAHEAVLKQTERDWIDFFVVRPHCIQNASVQRRSEGLRMAADGLFKLVCRKS